MSLKTLISIKFVMHVIAFLSLTYLSWNVTDSYEALENQNIMLKEQKEHYEQILTLKENDSEGKKELYDVIKVSDSLMKSESEKNTLSLSTSIWIMFFSCIFFYNIFNYLNVKIEKLKSEETETESLKML